MDDHESNKKILFSSAMRREWSKVIEMYTQDPRLHKSRITRSGHTALHIAVSEGKDDVVKQMVDIMSQKQPSKQEFVNALRTHENERNNTALHVAASIGNARICHIIATMEHTLVDDRNVDGETPLFLAALGGRREAFLCLHYIRNPDFITVPCYGNCRRNNGDTILHCAINGEYFDLAFIIIHLYGELAYWVNEEGLSPLHLLASKPSAFRSGSRLGPIETLFYNCIYVEELKVENLACTNHQTFQSAVKESDICSHDGPDNYNTLGDIFCLIRRMTTVVHEDEEDPILDPMRRGSRVEVAEANWSFPVNYRTCCNLIKFLYLVLLIILRTSGPSVFRKILRKKETHTWSVQVMKQLLHIASLFDDEEGGGEPYVEYDIDFTKPEEIIATPLSAVKPSSSEHKKQRPNERRKETLLFTAAKDGVLEIIEKTLEFPPRAIHDLNEDKKNIVLLAVEHRQPHVYQFLLKKNIYKESLFHQMDKDGNSVLHLAATFDDEYKPWLIPGEALQLQWELKWYKFVKDSMPAGFIRPYNKNHQTSDEIFTRTHSGLVKSGSEWLRKTSESCSVVAALVATVAFATSTTVPGGVNQDSGYPTLEKERAFNVFAASSLVALCCSIMAVVTFLSLLTSRFQEQDFYKYLPMKLLLGLTLLLLSIASMMVSFCAGHFFVLKHQLHHAAFALYAITFLSVIFYVLAQFPLYVDYLRATFTRVPRRG